MIKLKKLTIHNFGSFRSENVIEFPDSGLVLLHGDNGSGKSSVLKAIAYCLDFLSEPATEFINWDTQDPLLVELVLSLKGQDLTITRGTGFHRLEYGNIKAQGAEVPKRLATLLLNPTFMAIMSYRGQGDDGNFSSLKPSEKQDFLSELQSLNDFEKVIEQSEINISVLESKIEQNKKDYGTLFNSAQFLVGNIDRDSGLKQELEIKLANHTIPDLQALDAKIQKVSLEKESFVFDTKFDDRIEELEKTIWKDYKVVLEYQDEDKALIKEQNELLKDSASLRSQVYDIDKIKLQIESLKKNICPTCHQSWQESNNKLLELETKLKDLYVKKAELSGIEAENNVILEKRKEINLAYRQAVEAGTALMKEQEELKAQKAANNSKFQLLEKEIENLNIQKNFLLKQFELEKDSLKKQIEQYDKNIELNTKKLEELDSKLETIQNNNLSYSNQINKEKEVLNASRDFLRLITEDTLKLISSEASKVVQKLPNSKKFFINFDTSKLNKNGKIKKEIVLQILRNGLEVPFKRLSGGEKCSVHLATDLAVSHVLSLRTGKVLGWFIFDEALDGLSVENKKMAIQTLKDISKNKVILICEHSPEISEEFDKVINVKKTESGSRIELISKGI